MIKRRGESPQVQALPRGPQNVMIVSQEANMEEVRRALRPVCDVVAYVESNLDICLCTCNSITAIIIRHFQL
jgi:hypothetical protein